MPSWTEIQEFARSKYVLSRDEVDWFSLTFGFDDGRSQLIRIRCFNAFASAIRIEGRLTYFHQG